MTILTPTEIDLLRTRSHLSRLYLSVYKPNTLYTGVVVGDYDRGATEIVYSTISGDPAPLPRDLTVWVGTTVGDNDLGKVRLHTVDSGTSTIIVAENSIEWQNGAFITIIAFYDIWPIYYRIVHDDNNVPTFYKDYNIPYDDNQNSIFDPIPVMGPHLAGMLVDGVKEFYFDAAGSYDFTDLGGSLSYAWSFEGATTLTSSLATPGWIAWDTPGHYTVALTVSNTTTLRSYNAYRHVSVYTDIGGNSPPIVNWTTNNLQGDAGSGVWSGQIQIREDVGDSIIDGALIVIFAEDYYGDNQISIGGNYPNREDIVFVGYVRDGSVSIDPETSVVSFSVTNLAGKMQSREVYAILVTSSVDPTDWYHIKNMTVDLAIYHFLRWHTTVYRIADVVPNGSLLPVEEISTSRSFMFGSLNEILRTTLVGGACVDRQGKLWLETKVDIIPELDRSLGTVMTLTRSDWLNNLDFAYVREQKCSYVELGGVAYTGPTDDIGTAIISCAPGFAPNYQGSPTKISQLVLVNQTDTNELAGNYLAMLNKKFPELNITFTGNYRVFDIAPQERLLVNLAADENYANIVWTDKSFIAQSVSLAYDSAQRFVTVKGVFSEESSGPAGIAGPYVQSVEDLEPDVNTVPGENNTPTIPGATEPDGSKRVYVATTSKVGVTDNFTGSSPYWYNITGSIAGETIVDFILDPYSPKTTGFCLTTKSIWKSTTLNLTTPAWFRSLAIEGANVSLQFASNLDPQFGRMKSSISGSGRFRVLAYAQVSAGSATYDQYCYLTNNGGTSWSRHATGGTAGVTSIYNFSTDLEGWAQSSLRVCPIIGETDYSTPTGTVSWNASSGRTTPGCMQFTIPGVGGGYPSMPASSCAALINIPTRVVATGETYLDFYWRFTSSSFSPELLARVTFNDDTCQDYIANTGGSGSWNHWSVDISVGNNGKTAVSVMIALCNTGLDWFGTNTVVIDDLKIFGTGVNSPIKYAFDAGQHNGNILYAGTAESIRRTTNGGSVWSDYITGVGANDIECHYNNNASDADITFWATDGNLYRSTGSSKGSSLRTESPITNKSGRLVSYVNDKNVLYSLTATGTDVFKLDRTLTGGSSWSSLVTNITGAKAIGLWPWGTFSPTGQGVYVLNSTGIFFSGNGGSSFVDKTGNWSTAMGSAFSSPIMIVPLWVA